MQQTRGTFAGRNQIEIFHQAWRPETPPRALILLLHGMGEHSGRYDEVASRLVALGCAVHALDHRGHGRSGDLRGLIDRAQHAVDDIHTFAGLARRQYDADLPVYLLGHSMGGALSLAYALAHGETLSGVMLSGPAVALDAVPPLVGPISKLLSRWLPRLGTFPVDPSQVTRDPAKAARYVSDPLNLHDKVPVRTLAEVIALVQGLQAGLPAFRLPLLIQHGSHDTLAGVAGSERVLARVASTDKTLKVYQGLYHEIFNELPRDRERVLDDLTGWLAARLPPVRPS